MAPGLEVSRLEPARSWSWQGSSGHDSQCPRSRSFALERRSPRRDLGSELLPVQAARHQSSLNASKIQIWTEEPVMIISGAIYQNHDSSKLSKEVIVHLHLDGPHCNALQCIGSQRLRRSNLSYEKFIVLCIKEWI